MQGSWPVLPRQAELQLSGMMPKATAMAKHAGDEESASMQMLS